MCIYGSIPFYYMCNYHHNIDLELFLFSPCSQFYSQGILTSNIGLKVNIPETKSPVLHQLSQLAPPRTIPLLKGHPHSTLYSHNSLPPRSSFPVGNQ